MSDSSGGKRFETLTVTGFCVLAAVASLILIYSVGLLNGKQAERRNSNPHSHSETAKQKAESACVGTNPAAVFECVIGYVEASEDTAYTEQDLTAQQRAAWGALVAAFAGLLSVAASVLGLYWIKGTLDATRDVVGESVKATRAMESANQIAMLAQRPWIEINVEVESASFKNGFLMVYYNVIFKNSGKTVADFFWPHVQAFAHGDNYSIAARTMFDGWKTPQGQSNRVLIPGEEYVFSGRYGSMTYRLPKVEGVEGKWPWRTNLVVIAAAFYHIPGETGFDKRKFVERTFRIGTSDEDPIKRFMIYHDKLSESEPVQLVVCRSGPSAGN
jgi:hypothetical protein